MSDCQENNSHHQSYREQQYSVQYYPEESYTAIKRVDEMKPERDPQNDQPQNSLMLDQRDYMLQSQLVSAGFNTENNNLMLIQLLNSIQAQADVLEKVIFQNTSSSIFQLDIDFNTIEDLSQMDALAGEKVEPSQSHQPKKGKSSNAGKSNKHTTQVDQIDVQDWGQVAQEQKKYYLDIRRIFGQVKSAVNQSLSQQQGNKYVCVVCQASFQNGRKLGGHMSRSHPGSSLDYSKKKAIKDTKAVEKERRHYFKKMKSSENKTKAIAKEPKNQSKSNSNQRNTDQQ